MAAAPALASSFQVFVGSARMQILQTPGIATTVVPVAVQPIVLLLVTMLPLGEPSEQQATRLVVGVLLTAFWSSTIWGAASILRRDRFEGTLDRLLLGQRAPWLVVLARGLGSSLVTVCLTVASITGLLLVLQQPIMLDRPVWVLLGLALVLASGASIGLLVGSLFVLTRYGPQLSSALMYPVFILGGMLIPADRLPVAVRWVSQLISLRWLQEFLVSAAAGRADLTALAAAVVLTVAYAALGVVLFGRIVGRVRVAGGLDAF